MKMTSPVKVSAVYTRKETKEKKKNLLMCWRFFFFFCWGGVQILVT